MKKILLGFSLLLALLGESAQAQSTEVDVSARLIGKPLLLRGFWMDDNLEFDSTGLPLGTYKVGSFAESAFDAQKVKIVGDHLTIEGQRVALSFRNGNAERLPMRNSRIFDSSPEKVTIVVDGHGNQDFNQELDVIFASGLYQIAPSLPGFWKPYACVHFLPATQQTCKDLLPSVGVLLPVGKVPNPVRDVKPPKVIHTIQPKYTDAAKQHKFSGNMEIYLWVEKDGTPSHITIVRPVGLGLDEAGAVAASKYRFAPATQNGIPVMVDLYLNVNFMVF